MTPGSTPPDDLQRFTSLCRAWWGIVRDSAGDVLRSEHAGEDAAQRVFMKLWKGGGWRDVHKAAAFFHEAGRREGLKMAYNCRRRRALLVDRGAPLEWLSHSTASPDRAVIRAEWQTRVRHLVRELPPRCSLMCALTWLEGLSHQEVADRLGVSVKAVEKQVARGRRHLRERIQRSA